MEFKIDFKSWWYRNCVTRRRQGAKICGECPFRSYIESEERIKTKRRKNEKGQKESGEKGKKEL